ncbi:MAG: ATP-binding protein [Acidimicrobiales bacterium]|nr:two-component sensor histidine kinase [Acidimicrobiaceae bacterium]MDP7257759.1 ATP-binding protein [Acidimicrobiales bacterium]HJO80511.1 ATP-binding protein [Acidimicrobiales bacterium]|tara:strand:- start:1128 stop:2576 length:1449 start_codon:yes stop_codon:yes gene_type:complete
MATDIGLDDKATEFVILASDDSRPRPLGLRARISLSFAVGGLLVSVVLAGATLVLTRRQLIDSRESAAAAVAVSNATRLSNQLTPDATIEDLPAIADSLTKIEGFQRLIRLETAWLPTPELDREDLPPLLLKQLADRKAGQQRSILSGQTHLVVGIPLTAFDADYFAVVDLADVEDTLGNLQIVLFGASIFATLVAAIFGAWVSQRTLLPLRRVRSAAEAIAGGRLDTRLEPQTDPDLDRLADSFNEMARALEERILRDARFASDVSHELRSPLTTLKASVGVLEARREELSERSQTALTLLSDDLERFTRLVVDLLEISGYDAGAAALELSEVQVAQFLTAATRGTVSVPLQLPLRAGDLMIRADKRRLARLISNLLDNADRYGGGATSIIVESDISALRIAVEDQGPGVPPEERTAIFERFSRGSAGGRRSGDSGTGLGLSLVIEDVKLHKGRVWVEDRPDGASGARFVIELPMDGEKAQ